MGFFLSRTKVWQFWRSFVVILCFLLPLFVPIGLIVIVSWLALWLCESQMSLGNAAYVTAIAITTIGFGDVFPESWGGRVLCVADGLLGMVLLGLLAGIAFRIVSRIEL